MTTYNRVTGKDVQLAMTAADIKCVEHHQCGICAETVFYLRYEDKLFFDSSCGCATPRQVAWDDAAAKSAPRQVAWDDAAEWINMQDTADMRNRLRSKFGLAEQPKDTK